MDITKLDLDKYKSELRVLKEIAFEENVPKYKHFFISPI